MKGVFNKMTVELNKIKDFIVEWNNQNTNDFYNVAKGIQVLQTSY